MRALNRDTPEGSRRFYLFETLFALLAVMLAALAWWGFGRYYQGKIGLEQPIPFSHRLHAGEKKIGCLFCHDTAPWSARAGIPPLATCMHCHGTIAIHYPPIADLRSRYFSGAGVQWVRVNWVNEFVYFPHSMHLQAGIDCGRCHGNVREMDRVVKAAEFRMGFCMECHRQNRATTDCYGCHR